MESARVALDRGSSVKEDTPERITTTSSKRSDCRNGRIDAVIVTVMQLKYYDLYLNFDLMAMDACLCR